MHDIQGVADEQFLAIIKKHISHINYYCNYVIFVWLRHVNQWAS
jgi:hypothetical protein